MSKRTRRTFSSEFRLESAQSLVDQNYSIKEATQAVGVGHPTMDKWVRHLCKEHVGVTSSAPAIAIELPSVDFKED